MTQFGSLTHLGLYLIDKETGGPITRHPIYAEVVVTQYDPGSDRGRIDEAVSAGVYAVDADIRRQMHDAVRRAVSQAIRTGLAPASVEKLCENIDLTAELTENVLRHMLDRAGVEHVGALDTEQIDSMAAEAVIDNATGMDLEPMAASDRSVKWSAPLGVLWTDHVGYASYDLTRLPSLVCHYLDSEAGLRRAGVVRRGGDGGGEEAISIRALPYGSSGWIDVLNQSRFTDGAVVGRLVVPQPGLRPPHYEAGMSSMQNPSLTDWQLSPSSFATNPNQLIGENGCENLYPATLSLHEFVTRQVVRLSDDPPGIDIPDPYRAAYIDEYKVTWSALGHSLGEILYSMPLAPGESVKLAVIDWSWDSLTKRDENTKLTEEILHQTHRDRTISETVQAGLREMQHGSNFMGGVAHSGGGSGGANLGVVGLGAAVGDAWSMGGSTATSEGSRDLTAQNVQRLSDSFSQASSAQRELNSTVVIQARQEEKETIQTRTFSNYNRAHTLTILYYEVLRHYRVTVQFLRRRPAVLVKYPGAITTFGMAELLRHRAALEPVLLDPTLAPGFAALVKQDQVARNQTLHNVDPTKLDKPIPQFWEGDIRFALFEFGVKTSDGLRDKTDELAMVNLIVVDGNSTVTRPLLKQWEKGSETDNINVGERLNDTAMGWFITKPSSGPIAWRDLVGFEFVLHDDDEWRMDRLAIRAFHPGGAVALLDDTDVDFYFPLNGASNTVTFIRRPGPRPADLPPTWSPAKSLTPEEYQAAQRLIDHANSNNAYYNRAIMLATRTADISVAFESMPWQDGKTLADVAMPTPLEVFGNHVAYPLTAIGVVVGGPPPEAQAERLITMPTRGVFAEGKLGHCNIAEEIDNTRFWKWEEHPIPIQAPDIAPVTPTTPNPTPTTPTPTQFPQSLVNVVSPTAAPDPVGLAAALQLLGTPDIFRDMSGRAEVADLLKKLSDNTISIAEAANRAREIQAKYGSSAAGGSGGGAAEPSVGLGSGRTTPSDRSSTTTQDLQDLQHVLGNAQAKNLMTPQTAQDTFTKAAQRAYDPDYVTVGTRAPGTTVPVTAANDTQLGQAAAVEFFNATDVDNYFLDTTGKTFAGWFSATLAGRGSWGPLSMSMDIDTLNRFTETWNAFPAIVGTDRGAGVPGISLPEFATLMAKFLHETGGRLLFRGAETVGGYGHPGLSYAFDSFVIQRPGENPFTKGSYNTSNGNRTAFACFHDPVYLAVFGTLAPTAQVVRDRTEWKGTVWPSGVPTTIDSSTAFLQEADFYKFRGRGAIQSTGRVAYLPIVDFVRGYTGDDSRITVVKQRWATVATTLASQGITLTTNDDFATASSNADWDALFQSITIQAVAIRGHNNIPGKHYLPMSSSAAVLRGTGRGSAYFVAIAIAGNNPSYGNDVRQRMLEFIGTLWRTPMPAPGSGGGTIEL
ncbi:hypothetical protein [Nocardia amamiensis]|uniref:hypothetical protein n=1 Tax=Nocardia amamiensis TaxID=404578 RepID=UPI00082F45FB|nr:hypothetical protein [Nocardia amamiensis]